MVNQTGTIARSNKWLRDRGYEEGIVERYIYQTQKKKDLYGFIDIVALLRGERGLTGVQATTYPQITAHKDKALTNGILELWLDCGNRFEIHGWRKVWVKNRDLWIPTRCVFRLGGSFSGVWSVTVQGDEKIDEAE